MTLLEIITILLFSAILVNIFIFIIYIIAKHIIHKLIQKEIKRIHDKSNGDEQFLDMMYNIFELKEKIVPITSAKMPKYKNPPPPPKRVIPYVSKEERQQ